MPQDQNNLVWIDMEMSGLDPETNVILEVATIVTNEALEVIAEGPDLVFAGGLYPQQPAVRAQEGWRISGTWKFASGCKGAEVLGVGIITSRTTAS